MLRNEIPDKTLLQKVNHRLMQMGSGTRSRFTATVCRGEVTLSGTLQYEMQRSPLVRAASNVAGIRRVIDQLSVAPQKKKWD